MGSKPDRAGVARADGRTSALRGLDPMAGEVRQVPLTPAARALCSLPRIDYADAFVAGTEDAQALTAEEWARRILGDSPVGFRVAAPATWFALGLKHGLPWSDDNVLGWPVRRSEPDFILLGAQSRTGMPAELLLKRETDSLLFATFLQLRGPVMKRVWSLVGPPHRRIVPRLIRRGVRAS